ncbi:MAG: TniQ family protein [Rhodoferax sp.]|nr:TniQ family protein [Rhodoferax sp.]MDP3651667.1 TniQ family protein [Rhodoferax sp.]
MKGFTASLWPIRYKPFPDELLSSWLVRLAHGHGLKVQTFCNLIFGNRNQVWNRDVDRFGPEWLVRELSVRTGTPMDVAYATTLRSYEGRLYAKFRASGTLPWLQTLKVYHRTREGFGLQYCGACLAEDATPHFRKAWRVSFNTICVKHDRMLHDRCPQCGCAIMFHRVEMGRGSAFDALSMTTACHACGFNLSESPSEPITSYDLQASAWHAKLCNSLGQSADQAIAQIDLDAMRVMHQLTAILLSRYKTVSLRDHACQQLGIEVPVLLSGRVSIETRPLAERHHLMQLVAWLWVDMEPRLHAAWRSRAVRYNHLCKDFEDPPIWYVRIVEKFSNWRNR